MPCVTLAIAMEATRAIDDMDDIRLLSTSVVDREDELGVVVLLVAVVVGVPRWVCVGVCSGDLVHDCCCELAPPGVDAPAAVPCPVREKLVEDRIELLVSCPRLVWLP